jgi:hypothetical protein
MITLVSGKCDRVPTVLFCAAAPGLNPVPAVIPAVPLVANTFNEVKGGAVLNPVPLPAAPAIGDTVAVKYIGGNVALVDAAGATVYVFNPVGDLNKVQSVVWDGLAWVLK